MYKALKYNDTTRLRSIKDLESLFLMEVMAMEIIREMKGKYIISKPEHILKYVDEFRNEDKEYFIVLGLDTQNKVTFREIVSIGILNQTIIHPREIFKKAIINSCNSIICVHNHPSGNLEPSPEDLDIAKKLNQAGELLQIKVLDQIIITHDNIKSYQI